MAILGRRDFPTDGVEDYCTFLGEALRLHGIELEQARVPWAEKGWIGALRQLSRDSAGWRGRWVLLQYTALAWSRRGFAVGALAVLAILRRRGARVAVVFHDPVPFVANGLYGGMRSNLQTWVMRRLALRSDRAISALPTERMPWVRTDRLRRKIAMIPIGPNIPEISRCGADDRPRARIAPMIAVFGVTGRDRKTILREVSDIAHAVKHAAERASPLHLVVFGRGSEEAERPLREALRNVGVKISVLGLLPAERVAGLLADADVMLFVRGHLSSRRGSAIAGIACGLPVVAYAGAETGHPVTEAGVELVPEGDREALAVALARVIAEAALRHELQRRSVQAHAEYFSWNGIAQRLVAEVTKV